MGGIAPGNLFVELVYPGTAAAQAGLLSGDKILSINGATVHSWQEAKGAAMKEPLSDPAIEVARNGQTLTLNLKKTSSNKEFWGIRSTLKLIHPKMVFARDKTLYQATKLAVKESLQWSGLVFSGLWDLPQSLRSKLLVHKVTWFGDNDPLDLKGTHALSFYLK